MEEESKPYCQKFYGSQSNGITVDCATVSSRKLLLSQWAKVKARQWSKVLRWLDLLLLRQWPEEDWANLEIRHLVIPFVAWRYCRNFHATANSHWLIFVRRVTSRIYVACSFVATLVVLFSVSPKSEIVLQCFSFVSVQVGNFTHKSVLNVNVNSFCNHLGYSLPKCDLQLMCGV